MINAKELTIRAGSTYHEVGGTIHSVTGGFYHESYNSSNNDYDVAVLRVCTDFDITIDILKYMLYL
jgi:hypothetical protein